MNSVCFLILFGISFRVNLAVEFPDLTSHYKEVLERKNSEFSYTGKSSNTVSKARQSIEKLKQFTDDPDKAPIYNICTAFLKEFGYRSSNFIQCSVENARPFRFCESCVVEYKRSMTTFEDILQDDSRWNGCRDILLKADRIQVLDQVYNNIKNVWSQAFCDGCFEDGSITEDVNGTVSYVYSDTAKEFRYLFDNVTSCISSHSNISMVQQTDLSLNSSVCYACLPDYVALNKKFTDAMEKSSQAVCMDLVDMMNYTRITWGLTLQCTRTHPTNAKIIVITVGIAVLTVCFYVVLGIRGSKKEKKIMKQKRMSLRSAAALYGATLQVHQDGGDTNQDGLDDKDDKGVFG